VHLVGAGFLVVRDNGAGMDAVGLENLATYFRTQVRFFFQRMDHRRADGNHQTNIVYVPSLWHDH